MLRFHAHIYFGSHEQNLAQSIAESFKKAFENEEYRMGPLEKGIRGPHLMSQFEIDVEERHLGRIFNWLRVHRQGLSVLIHPELEDEIRSHLTEAIWLGIPLPLDFSKLDLRIHGRSFVPLGTKPKELEA